MIVVDGVIELPEPHIAGVCHPHKAIKGIAFPWGEPIDAPVSAMIQSDSLKVVGSRSRCIHSKPLMTSLAVRRDHHTVCRASASIRGLDTDGYQTSINDSSQLPTLILSLTLA